MRITDWMRTNDTLYNIQRRVENMSDYQSMMSTGKRIKDPSDDPAGTGNSLHFRHRIASNQQYQRNIQDGLSYLTYTDGVLEGVGILMNEAMSKAVQGDNEALTPDDRQVVANEVNQLLEELVSKANTSYSGKYLFAGYNNDTAPFTVERDSSGLITSVTANPDGIDGSIDREIGDGLREQVNTSGGELFQSGGAGSTKDLFQMLITLRDGLTADDSDVIGGQIEAIQEGIDHVSIERSTIGARVNYFDRRLSQLQAEEVNLTDSLSQWEDADIVEAAMLFEQEQMAYEAALTVASRVLQMGLLEHI